MPKGTLCPMCSAQDTSRSIRFLTEPLEIQDSCLYEIPCIHGSLELVHLQEGKFVHLYESAIGAMRNRHYREAVTSFAVAVERFYEFCIGVFLMDNFDPQDVWNFDEQVLKNYAKLWKQPLKLSERQVGAFSALYFSEFSESPILFDSAFSSSLKREGVIDPTDFRNRVTHAGYVPSYGEVLEFGETAKLYIGAIITKLLEKDKDRGMTRIRRMPFLERNLAFLKRGEPVRGMGPVATMTFLKNDVAVEQSLAEYIENPLSYDGPYEFYVE